MVGKARKVHMRLFADMGVGGSVGPTTHPPAMESLSLIRARLPQTGEQWIEKITLDVLDSIISFLDVKSILNLGDGMHRPYLPLNLEWAVTTLISALYRLQ